MSKQIPEPAVHDADLGSGSPVVFIAGLGGLGAFWQPVMARLAARYRCITFDHPGVGRGPPCGEHGIGRIADEVLRLLDQRGLESAHVVGHSTGGLVAQALALDHPARVGRLVLSATWARPDRHFRDLFAMRRAVLQRAGFATYNTLGRLLGYPPAWYEAHLASDAPIDFDAAGDGDPATTLARIDMLLGFDRADELGRIQVPTLIVGAGDDAIVPWHHALELARRMPSASLRRLDGGHFMPQVEAARYAALLEEFFPME